MDDKLFLVTFKQIDPLFVIDLADQKNPKIIGELKIPGYSRYLHPYDENHLIGLGYDTYTNKW
jgi:inhibitor of cysteine peptidase